MALQNRGLKNLVLCPGSRSAPLALAAGLLAESKLICLFTAIDERSAAFLALGQSASTGEATAVITTSGTAVAELLPAVVEADRSCYPLILITADRPKRLKNCGANQTVNQEDFLSPVCRDFLQPPQEGFHLMRDTDIDLFAAESWQKAHLLPGPVHLNIPFEEPLYPTKSEQKIAWNHFSNKASDPLVRTQIVKEKRRAFNPENFPSLKPELPGVIIVGPWRGPEKTLPTFLKALSEWQMASNWPVLADPLSGVSSNQVGLIKSWEVALKDSFFTEHQDLQVMRLGPLPASRSLEDWLRSIGGKQLLVTENDTRNLDPLSLSEQWSKGLDSWWKIQNQFIFVDKEISRIKNTKLLKRWIAIDQLCEEWLDSQLPLKGAITEPSLARWLPRLIPQKIPFVLSASSPVRDWLSFSGSSSFSRRCFSFRGASGIDGTLSLGLGVAIGMGPTVLVTGDLALLHDSNGWLLASSTKTPLVVVLIDNSGGGIFQRLKIDSLSDSFFEELFAMPQSVDQLALAAAHSIPTRQVSCLEDLPLALEWGMGMSETVLIRVCPDAVEDAILRQILQDGLLAHLQAQSQKDHHEN